MPITALDAGTALVVIDLQKGLLAYPTATLPVDVMTDLDPAMHEHSVTRIFPRIAEAGSADDVLALLAAREARP